MQTNLKQKKWGLLLVKREVNESGKDGKSLKPDSKPY